MKTPNIQETSPEDQISNSLTEFSAVTLDFGYETSALLRFHAAIWSSVVSHSTILALRITQGPQPLKKTVL